MKFVGYENSWFDTFNGFWRDRVGLGTEEFAVVTDEQNIVHDLEILHIALVSVLDKSNTVI